MKSKIKGPNDILTYSVEHVKLGFAFYLPMWSFISYILMSSSMKEATIT